MNWLSEVISDGEMEFEVFLRKIGSDDCCVGLIHKTGAGANLLQLDLGILVHFAPFQFSEFPQRERSELE